MRTRHLLQLVLLSALWGASFLFIRIASPALGPHVAAALRIGLATLTLASAVGYAAVAGQAAWVRFVDGAGTAVYHAEAGLPGSGKPVILTDGKTPPTTNLFVGGEVQLASAVWVE